jgi:hypothetical protein
VLQEPDMRLVSPWSRVLLVAAAACGVALFGGGVSADGRAAAFAWSDSPHELTIDWVSDCTPDRPDRVPPQCGAPPALWNAQPRLVAVCTLQGQRATWWTAEQFRAAVQAAADDWNVIEAGIGLHFVGDCADQTPFERGLNDGRNVIAFDDARNVVTTSVSPTALAVTFSLMTLQGGVRSIRDADIVLGTGDLVRQCPAVVLRHELGHVLGFGHSDQATDLLAAAPPAPVQICTRQPTASEQALLQQMYGVNRRPTASISAPPPASPGAPVALNAVAADPEGGVLTYEWAQVRGTPVQLMASGPVASFLMPVLPAGDLEFRLTVRDTLLKPAVASIVVGSGVAGASPRVLGGSVPLAGGFGLVVFSGGSSTDLLQATCGAGLAASAAFWATNAQGQFVVYVPSAAVAAVNAPWQALFPLGVPASSAVLVRCR